MGDEHPNLTLARQGFDAIARGDTQWMNDHLADDVVWHVGGNSKMAGEYRGKDTVMQFMAVPSGSAPGIDMHDVLANDDHVVSMGTARLEAPDGDKIEYRFVNIFHIRDGKVTEAWGMSENDAETDPFFDKLAPS